MQYRNVTRKYLLSSHLISCLPINAHPFKKPSKFDSTIKRPSSKCHEESKPVIALLTIRKIAINHARSPRFISNIIINFEFECEINISHALLSFLLAPVVEATLVPGGGGLRVYPVYTPGAFGSSLKLFPTPGTSPSPPLIVGCAASNILGLSLSLSLSPS